MLDEQASSKRVAEIGVLGEVREERLVRLGNHPVVECDAVQQRDDALRDGPEIVENAGIERNDAERPAPRGVLPCSVQLEHDLTASNDDKAMEARCVLRPDRGFEIRTRHGPSL